MAPEVFSGVSIGGGNAATLLMQQFAVLCLAVVALVCAHEFLYHLHSILMPFVLSGFLVFAVEPAVDLVYGFLAGLSPPHRWCGCCFPRRCWPLPRGKPSAGRDGASSSQSEGGPEPDSDAAAAEPLLGAGAAEQPRGPLEGLCRFAAVGTTLLVMVMVGCAFISLLVRGAMHLKESWGAYQVGLDNWVKWLDMATMSVSGKLSLHHTKSVEAQFKAIYNYVLLRLQDAVSMLVNGIVATVSAGISTLVMVFLYVLFWLWRPLPICGNASALVRNYLVKKTFVSSVYGVGVALLFLAAGNDLAMFFGMVSFFLNYVPEGRPPPPAPRGVPGRRAAAEPGPGGGRGDHLHSRPGAGGGGGGADSLGRPPAVARGDAGGPRLRAGAPEAGDQQRPGSKAHRARPRDEHPSCLGPPEPQLLRLRMGSDRHAGERATAGNVEECGAIPCMRH
ncbi:unnamed protein product [Prorocentrum cordatum]|uniref:Uncharacterized protein n=1 Tax=Prorocentrum cordatum TaxID=2364126 RepID=A0ABN9UNP7_9DINO|nr:unnamed protein product [Polarella glacialis]